MSSISIPLDAWRKYMFDRTSIYSVFDLNWHIRPETQRYCCGWVNFGGDVNQIIGAVESLRIFKILREAIRFEIVIPMGFKIVPRSK